MRKLFLAVLFVLMTLPVMAATTHVREDDNARVELTDEPCIQTIADQYILEQYQPVFRSYKFIPKSPDMLRQTGGKAVVYGCWSDNPEIAPPGHFTYVNEFGSVGYQEIRAFERVTKIEV